MEDLSLHQPGIKSKQHSPSCPFQSSAYCYLLPTDCSNRSPQPTCSMQTRSYYVKLSILLVASTVCSPPLRKPTNQENEQMAPLSPSSAASVTLPGKRPRVGPGPSRAVPAKRRRDGGDSVGMLDRPSAHDTARRDANALMRAATNLGTRRDDDDADTLDGEIRPRVGIWMSSRVQTE